MAGEFSESRTRDDDALRDAARWGMSEEEIGAVQLVLNDIAGGTETAVWRMHVRALELLDAAGTQWRTRLEAVDGRLVARVAGLDYAAARVAWDALKLAATPHDWRRLMVLEAEAVTALNGGSDVA